MASQRFQSSEAFHIDCKLPLATRFGQPLSKRKQQVLSFADTVYWDGTVEEGTPSADMLPLMTFELKLMIEPPEMDSPCPLPTTAEFESLVVLVPPDAK